MAAKIKQIELSRRTGLPESTTSLIITGDQVASPDKLAKIASALNVSLDWLITGKDVVTGGHTDMAIEAAVHEHAGGWECKGEGFSDNEKRVIGMLRRLSPEERQHHFNLITNSYFDQMELEIKDKRNKD